MVRRGENVSTGAPLVRLVGLVILSLPEPVGAKKAVRLRIDELWVGVLFYFIILFE